MKSRLNKDTNPTSSDEPEVGAKDIVSDKIGVTFATEKYPSTIDGFWFFLKRGVSINPFDFVTVLNSEEVKTIGMINEILIVDDLHDTAANKNVNDKAISELEKLNLKSSIRRSLRDSAKSGLILAHAIVMANKKKRNARRNNSITINMPVDVDIAVNFSTRKEVMFALGIPEMGVPISAGIIEMTNGLKIPVTMDISYIMGPDTTHVNASGISGNSKTSYLLFLLESVYQKLYLENEYEVAIILFNTKEQDLLHIDKKSLEHNKKTIDMYKLLNLQHEPFRNVSYYLPRGMDGRPNSIYLPKNSKTFSYSLEDIYDRLEILLSPVADPGYDLSLFSNYINEAWPLSNGKKEVKSWSDLYNFRQYPSEIATHKSQLLSFLSRLDRFRKSPLFVDKKKTSVYLGDEIKKIKSGDIFVIDVAMISDIQEQALVIGDVMKTIDDFFAARPVSNSDKPSKKPRFILTFVDEINRFLPPANSVYTLPFVGEKIMRCITAGRTRGTILFSAQQFKSAVNQELNDNTGMHLIAKSAMSELNKQPYHLLDESTKRNITRLNKGELIMVHSAFRHPVKIIFPKASFKDPS